MASDFYLTFMGLASLDGIGGIAQLPERSLELNYKYVFRVWATLGDMAHNQTVSGESLSSLRGLWSRVRKHGWGLGNLGGLNAPTDCILGNLSVS